MSEIIMESKIIKKRILIPNIFFKKDTILDEISYAFVIEPVSEL